MKIDEIKQLLVNTDAFKTKDGEALFAQLMDSYMVHRIDETDVENDGDMLLYQWGTYDWGQGQFFQLDITRQIILDLEDPDEAADSMQQLSVTFKYVCNDETAGMGEGNKWCDSPSVVKDFFAFVKSSPPYVWAKGRRPVNLSIEFHDV